MVRLASLVGLLLLSGCAARQATLRRDGERVWVGREVSGAAYSWFLRGQWYEGAGRLAEAEYAYEQGLKNDPRSGMLYSSLVRSRYRPSK